MTPAAATIIVAALAGLWAPPAPARCAGPEQLGPSDLADAVALGLSRDEASRAAFHERYVLRLGGPVVHSLEVVTEFRRAVRMAEARARQGEVRWATDRAAAALEPYRGRLDLVIRLRFDPQNTYRAMPRVNVLIYRREGGPVLRAAGLQATPENYAGPVPPGTPILAATIEASFQRSDLDPSRPFLAGIFLDDREIERIPLDLGGLR